MVKKVHTDIYHKHYLENKDCSVVVMSLLVFFKASSNPENYEYIWHRNSCDKTAIQDQVAKC